MRSTSSDNFEGIEILFGQRKFKEFARIGDALRKTVEAADDIVEHLLFFAYFLGVFGIIPEVRVLNFPIYFFEAPSFAVDVKDTPKFIEPTGKIVDRGFNLVDAFSFHF